jgi:hypothetical protein
MFAAHTHPRRVFEAMVQTQHSSRNLIEDIEIANVKILPHPSPTLPEVCVCAWVNPPPRTKAGPPAPGDVDLLVFLSFFRARSDVASGVFDPFFR